MKKPRYEYSHDDVMWERYGGGFWLGAGVIGVSLFCAGMEWLHQQAWNILMRMLLYLS